jgi:hypothetical protein
MNGQKRTEKMPQSDRGKIDREVHAIQKSMSRWTMWVAVFTFCLVVTSSVSNLFIYLQYYTAENAQIEAREQSRAVVTNPSNVIVLPEDVDKPGGVMVVAPAFQITEPLEPITSKQLLT